MKWILVILLGLLLIGCEDIPEDELVIPHQISLEIDRIIHQHDMRVLHFLCNRLQQLYLCTTRFLKGNKNIRFKEM